jgi:hypothetical protein
LSAGAYCLRFAYTPSQPSAAWMLVQYVRWKLVFGRFKGSIGVQEVQEVQEVQGFKGFSLNLMNLNLLNLLNLLNPLNLR